MIGGDDRQEMIGRKWPHPQRLDLSQPFPRHSGPWGASEAELLRGWGSHHWVFPLPEPQSSHLGIGDTSNPAP